MANTDVIGQTIDGKYLIERELGRGGMGTVYLGTHIGTERPVALKVISPQFMKRPEFVERFRREARAAGRLRHPNVVDVTDFGFAETDHGRVAYLVMEYLDGCTLGEILEEEQNLPVAWTLDILEQVCSAVQEAHDQGIIHRDLKPDNIWLEPNQRGGYTVKVLDFGIAKLEVAHAVDTGEHEIRQSATPTFAGSANVTFGGENDSTIHDSISPTMIAEAATLAGLTDAKTIIQPAVPRDTPVGSEDRTAIFETHATPENADRTGTKLLTDSQGLSNSRALSTEDLLNDGTLATKDLTRVGAVLGTPLYMSPEQCAGYKLDARSDIYSLGVIAYQMLSGDTPFKGDFSKVMEAHKALPPPPLNAKKVRKKLKRSIAAALSKNPEARPQSAEAFASVLRSRSEGIFGLLRRAAMIWSEHMPKFVMLSTFFHAPAALLTVAFITLTFLKVSGTIDARPANMAIGTVMASLSIIQGFCAYLIIGTISWIVVQFLAVPLRPIRVRSSLKEARKKWKTFAGTGILSFVFAILIAIPTCGLGFLVTTVLWTLSAPVVMMEGLKGRAALKRSKDLVKRSLATSIAAVALTLLIPFVTAGAISFVVNITAKALQRENSKVTAIGQAINKGLDEGKANANANPNANTQTEAAAPTAPAESNAPPDVQGSETGGTEISINTGNRSIRINEKDKDMRTRVIDAVLESLLQLLLLPLQIVVTSFTAIILALLYLKTRQAGGESLQDLLSQFEDTDRPRRKWQERVRQRLIQSGRLTSSIKTG